MNRSPASKNCPSSLWVNSKIFLRIVLVLCSGKCLLKNFVTICSHDIMLLAGDVLNHKRALSFKENENNLSLTLSSEKFSYLKFDKQHENYSDDYMGLCFPSYRMLGDNLAH